MSATLSRRSQPALGVHLRRAAGARLAAVLAPPAASGVLLWTASPAVGLGWLAWVALVPALAAALARPSTRAGRLSVPLAYGVYLELLLVPALPFGLAHRQWGEPPVPIMVAGSPVVFAAAVAVPLAVLALYAVRFPFLGADTGGARLTLVLVPALAWTALDLLRVEFDPGGVFGPLFLSQHDTAAAALTALGGPWLVTLALVAVNAALALALLDTRRALAAVAVVLAAVVALGAAARAVAPAPVATVTVAAVQPGYDTAEFERPVLRSFRERKYEQAALDLIRDLAPPTGAAARRGADLVVWPEAALWIDAHASGPARAALRRLATDTGVTLVVPTFLPGTAGSAAVLVLPDGRLSRPRPKQRPMWFLGERAGEGPGGHPVPTPAGSVGTLLGVDAQHPAAARVLVRRGAALLSWSSHDWRALAPHHRAFAQLHAMALARPLVRADWRYGSAVVDGGRVVADAGGEKRRTVVVDAVHVTRARTPYARVGDAVAWGAAAGLLLFLVRRRASGG